MPRQVTPEHQNHCRDESLVMLEGALWAVPISVTLGAPKHPPALPSPVLP